jgi:hypothetical protein
MSSIVFSTFKEPYQVDENDYETNTYDCPQRKKENNHQVVGHILLFFDGNFVFFSSDIQHMDGLGGAVELAIGA